MLKDRKIRHNKKGRPSQLTEEEEDREEHCPGDESPRMSPPSDSPCGRVSPGRRKRPLDELQEEPEPEKEERRKFYDREKDKKRY